MQPNKFLKISTLTLLLGDVLALYLAFVLAYKIRFFTHLIPYKTIPAFYHYQQSIIFVITIFILIFYLLGVYQDKRGKSYLDEFYSILIAVIFSTLIVLAFTFFYRDFSYSRVMVIFSFFFTNFLVSLNHFLILFIQAQLFKKGLYCKQTAVIGDDEFTKNLLKQIKDSSYLGFNLVGRIGNNEGIKEFNYLGNLESFNKIVKQYNLDEIFLPLSSTSQQQILSLVLSNENENLTFTIVPDLLGIITSRVKFSELKGLPLLTLKPPALFGLNYFLKRTIDIFGSLIGIILFSPLILIISYLIKYSKLSAKGPAILTQERVGKEGKIFLMYKFRGMIVDAEKETGPVWAKKEDHRVTKIGKFLRRTSLDELPQLFNVFKGDMSLVGPRPERPFFVEKFSKQFLRYMYRHKVKPGITGWAQVNGLRGDTSIEERTKYDLYYIENWSLLLDIKILVKTVFEFLFHKNAY